MVPNNSIECWFFDFYGLVCLVIGGKYKHVLAVVGKNVMGQQERRNNINSIQMDVQSEDAGSTTLAKYWYQYNWALYHFISNCNLESNLAVSMEVHEDALFVNDVDLPDSGIELYQVKDISMTGNMTSNRLCKSVDKKPSIISKLIGNINKKHIKNRISKLAIVSATPYTFTLESENRKVEQFDVIRFEQLAIDDKEKIEEAVLRDLNIAEVPYFVEFIRGIKSTSLGESSSMVIGTLASYIDKNYPNLSSRPKLIYDAMVTELMRIGSDNTIYQEWNEFLSKHTVSQHQLDQIIKGRSLNIDNSFDNVWTRLCKYLDQETDHKTLTLKEKITLKKGTQQYYLAKKTSAALIFDIVNKKVEAAFEECIRDTMLQTAAAMVIELSKDLDIVEFFSGQQLDIKYAVLCEISEHV
ncbi:MAG: DUF4297 domain-containing protein [Algicola sp.]|nr:DUF4297 domain-containing protein [Algicola sp.]